MTKHSIVNKINIEYLKHILYKHNKSSIKLE